MGTADDAAVYRINSRTALVATVDFFAPNVDDPYTYGAVAAANAMSDVFAMGGEVVLALNVAAFPENLPSEAVREILRGGAEKVAEAGGMIAGGHTVWDEEPKYGLSVIGRVHPNRILRKNGLKPGDHLYLTKRLGTGSLLSGSKQGKVSDDILGPAVQSMLQLNRHASHLLRESGVTSATDVTGFGLLGHLWEMVSQSGVRARVDLDMLPALPGALDSLGGGTETGGGERNREWVGTNVEVAEGVSPVLASLAFDPQTSGGLLFSCSRRRAAKLEAAFARDGHDLWRIGSVEAGNPAILLTGG